MRSATCLTLLAIGAILTFAVTGHPSFLNLQVVGVVVMATGVAGLLLPRRGWPRRPIVVHGDAHEVARWLGRRQRSPRFQELGPGAAQAEQNGNPADRPADSPTVPDLMTAEHPDDD